MSIAYAASIGGVGTLVGTPPNIIFVSIASRTAGMEVSVATDYRKLGETVKQMGCTLDSPFMSLSFLSLLVVPELRIGEKGLFDYAGFNWVDSDGICNNIKTNRL